MAKFCANCGSPVEDGDRVCGHCGTPMMDVAANESMAQPDEKKDNKLDSTKIIKYAIILIAAIVVCVIAVNICSKFTGYNGTLRKTFKALQNNDVDALEKLTPSFSEDIYTDMYGKKYYERFEDRVNDVLDEFEDRVGNIKSIKYEIKDYTEFSSRRVEEMEDELVDEYNVDVSGISKIAKVELKLTVKGNKKSASYNVDDLYLIKESGKWKILYGDF